MRISKAVFEDDPDGEPIKADDLEVVLGDEVIERSFTDNLIGVEQDEEKEFTVAYPEEFSSSLAGKTVHYKAKIKSVGTIGDAGAERRLGEEPGRRL